MKLKFNSRKWHAWISFAISIPILLVAISAILIAHGQALGFRDIKVDPSWLPGYSDTPVRSEARALLHTDDGLWIGTQNGLFVKSAAGINAIDAFANQEIRALLVAQQRIFVLSAQGLFAQQGDEWEKISRGPVQSAFVDSGMLHTLTRDKGLQVFVDNQWQAPADATAALADLPASSAPMQLPLARVIRDLHTGEALLGHDAEWIWNDIVGGTMTFLALTGVYLWWKGQRRLVFAKRER